MYNLFSKLQIVTLNFFKFLAHFSKIFCTMLKKRTYRIAVVASEEITAQLLAAAIDGCGNVVVCTANEEELTSLLDIINFDLVVVASTSMHLDDTQLLATIADLRRSCTSIFVVARHLSVATTLQLLGSGVSQCMSFPINLYRLRRKVKEQLMARDYRNEAVS